MINDLVNNLPELYQPIFGHDELTLTPSRHCGDRFNDIRQIYNSLEKLLNRPLKVLDLGCAQGYFAFSLAKQGAIVTGIDHLKENIVLCNALAMENPELSITFSQVRIEEFVDQLSPNQYDLILGLSVFHHLIHTNGIPQVKSILKRLADLSRVMLLEFASRSEPCYWGPTQPDDPRTLIDDISFTHLIANYPTHLSDVHRPLFVASNSYCIFGEKVVKFDNWSNESHALSKSSHEFSRRYYFNNEEIVKLYRLNHSRGIYNETEYRREVEFLRSHTKGFRCSSLIAAGSNYSESWICIERLPGKSLLDLILNGEEYDAHRVIRDILEQLSCLESAGLYHNDLRTWNVLLDKNNNLVYLIDYGSISANPRDCSWPKNLFLAFFIFLNEVATGCIFDSVYRMTPISPSGLPEPYKAWANSLWERAINDWSFKLMYQTFPAKLDVTTDASRPQPPIFAWMNAIEEMLQVRLKFFDDSIENTNRQAQAQTHGAIAIAQQANARAALAEASAQDAEVRAVQAEASAQFVQAHVAQAEVSAQQVKARVTQAELSNQRAKARVDQAKISAQQAQSRVALAEISIQQTKARVAQAEMLAKQAEVRVFETETLTLQARARTADAESLAQQQQARVAHAEASAQQAEARATIAEMSVHQAEARTAKAEMSIQLAEARIVQAYMSVQQAEERTAQSLTAAQQAEARAAQAETTAQQAEDVAVQADVLTQQAEARSAHFESVAYQALMQMQVVLATKSWRVTAPLRWIYWQVRALREHGFNSRHKAFAEKVLRKIIQGLSTRPELRKRLVWWSRKLGLYPRLKRTYYSLNGTPQIPFIICVTQSQAVPGLERLPPGARQIFADLCEAVTTLHKKDD